MTLWLDDIRHPIAHGCFNCTWVKTVEEFKKEWLTGNYTHCSLDHDLGACVDCMRQEDVDDPEEWLIKHHGMAMPNCPHVGTGYDICCWFEANPELWPKVRPDVHSANPVGRVRMQQVIKRYYDAK